MKPKNQRGTVKSVCVQSAYTLDSLFMWCVLGLFPHTQNRSMCILHHRSPNLYFHVFLADVGQQLEQEMIKCVCFCVCLTAE